MAKQSGGAVRISSRPGEGTTVTLFLPRAQAAAPAGAAAAAALPAPLDAARAARSGGATLLVADDDPGVRDFTAETLRGTGHQVIEAADGWEALAAIEATEHLDLLVVDFAMPYANGIEVARRARQRFPGLPVLLVTAYAQAPLDELPEGYAVLLKPFRVADLHAHLGEALEAGAGSRRKKVAQGR
jgi:CheY-like chemotaxis protein